MQHQDWFERNMKYLDDNITKKELMKCPKCGKRLKAVIDKKTGKKSKYEFGCSCSPKIRVCIG